MYQILKIWWKERKARKKIEKENEEIRKKVAYYRQFNPKNNTLIDDHMRESQIMREVHEILDTVR